MAGTKGRRGHNEGAIYQRADGRWVGAVHLGWEGGKRKRKVVYGKTRTEVNQKVTKLLAEQQSGLPIQTASKTVAQFLDEWIDQVIRPTKSPGTTEHYVSIVNVHLRNTIGKHKVDKLTQRHVQQLLNEKLASGLSPSMVKQIRTILRAGLNQAMKWDLVGRNVATLVTPPTTHQYEGYILTATDMRSISAAAQGEELEALYAVATSVGLRMGELIGLRWVDIDLEANSIQVRNQMKVIDGKPTLVPLKTRSSRRHVPMVGPVAAIMRRHRKRAITRSLEAGRSWSEEGYVFSHRDGRPMSDDYIRLRWYELRKAAGLPGTVRFHDLRHGALTILAARGTPARTLMGIAGHSNISTTMMVYAHLDDESVRASVDMMADLYGVEKETS